MFDSQDLPAVATQLDSPALPIPGGAQPVHVLDRLAAIFKHRRLAGAAFVVVAGVMMLQTYSQIPMFRTSARVIIQDERTVAVGSLNANDPMYWQDSDQYTICIQHSPKPRPGEKGRSAPRVAESSAVQRHRASPPGRRDDDCGRAPEGLNNVMVDGRSPGRPASNRVTEPG